MGKGKSPSNRLSLTAFDKASLAASLASSASVSELSDNTLDTAVVKASLSIPESIIIDELSKSSATSCVVMIGISGLSSNVLLI